MNNTNPPTSSAAAKYRGATVEDLDPPAALSLSPSSPIQHALQAGFERDYTHLTITSPSTRALLGYISIPRLKALLESHAVKDSDPVEMAMLRFRRKGRVYTTITPATPLEVLEGFFAGVGVGDAQGDGNRNGSGSGSGSGSAKENEEDFAVVTDEGRKFVLGVVTKGDLEEFVRRRPA